MGLIGNMIDDADSGSASTVNYCLFASAFTLLTLFYLIPATFWETVMMHPVIMFIIDLMNVVFTFCAAIALPSKLHAKSCSNKVCGLHYHYHSPLLPLLCPFAHSNILSHLM